MNIEKGRAAALPFFVLLFLSDHIGLVRAIIVNADQGMTGLGAKMWNVHNGRRVICQDSQRGLRRDRLQPFARFQHRQWAKQPDRIKCIGIIRHKAVP